MDEFIETVAPALSDEQKQKLDRIAALIKEGFLSDVSSEVLFDHLAEYVVDGMEPTNWKKAAAFIEEEVKSVFGSVMSMRVLPFNTIALATQTAVSMGSSGPISALLIHESVRTASRSSVTAFRSVDGPSPSLTEIAAKLTHGTEAKAAAAAGAPEKESTPTDAAEKRRRRRPEGHQEEQQRQQQQQHHQHSPQQFPSGCRILFDLDHSLVEEREIAALSTLLANSPDLRVFFVGQSTMLFAAESRCSALLRTMWKTRRCSFLLTQSSLCTLDPRCCFLCFPSEWLGEGSKPKKAAQEKDVDKILSTFHYYGNALLAIRSWEKKYLLKHLTSIGQSAKEVVSLVLTSSGNFYDSLQFTVNYADVFRIECLFSVEGISIVTNSQAARLLSLCAGDAGLKMVVKGTEKASPTGGAPHQQQTGSGAYEEEEDDDGGDEEAASRRGLTRRHSSQSVIGGTRARILIRPLFHIKALTSPDVQRIRDRCALFDEWLADCEEAFKQTLAKIGSSTPATKAPDQQHHHNPFLHASTALGIPHLDVLPLWSREVEAAVSTSPVGGATIGPGHILNPNGHPNLAMFALRMRPTNLYQLDQLADSPELNEELVAINNELYQSLRKTPSGIFFVKKENKIPVMASSLWSSPTAATAENTADNESDDDDEEHSSSDEDSSGDEHHPRVPQATTSAEAVSSAVTVKKLQSPCVVMLRSGFPTEMEGPLGPQWIFVGVPFAPIGGSQEFDLVTVLKDLSMSVDHVFTTNSTILKGSEDLLLSAIHEAERKLHEDGGSLRYDLSSSKLKHRT